MTTIATETCWRCRGDGRFWRVPDGFNPFYAGAQTTAGAMVRVRCYECDGTGRLECVTTEQANG